MIALFQTSNRFLAAFLSIFMKIESVPRLESYDYSHFVYQNFKTFDLIKGNSTIITKHRSSNEKTFLNTVSANYVTFSGLEFKTAGINKTRILLYTLTGLSILGIAGSAVGISSIISAN